MTEPGLLKADRLIFKSRGTGKLKLELRSNAIEWEWLEVAFDEKAGREREVRSVRSRVAK